MKKRQAFTLMEILVVVAIIGLIAMVGVPLYKGVVNDAHARARAINIEMVEAAKEQWALEKSIAEGSTVSWSDISGYMGSGIKSKSDLDVNDASITLGAIGTTAAY